MQQNDAEAVKWWRLAVKLCQNGAQSEVADGCEIMFEILPDGRNVAIRANTETVGNV